MTSQMTSLISNVSNAYKKFRNWYITPRVINLHVYIGHVITLKASKIINVIKAEF